MMEYALIVSAIALVVVAGSTAFGNALSTLFSGFANSL
jgi:Flp pilus assembly pilin Flp